MWKEFVEVNRMRFSTVGISSGVSQGLVLGLLLYLIYIKYIARNIMSKIRLFADDCIMYHTVTSQQGCSQLDSDLYLILEWCLKWQMSLNISKTMAVTVTRKKSVIEHNYVIGGHQIHKEEKHKYLGVIIS